MRRKILLPNQKTNANLGTKHSIIALENALHWLKPNAGIERSVRLGFVETCRILEMTLEVLRDAHRTT